MLSAKRQSSDVVKGNRVQFLANGEDFFPRLIDRIEGSQNEIFMETFILANDKIGKRLQESLIRSAKRGVWVSVTVDSWGSYYLDADYINSMTEAGIKFQVYDPQPSWHKGRPKVFRRMHRKLATIDARYAFIGGINCCDEHMQEPGSMGKQDYAVELEGAIVGKLRKLCKSYVQGADDSNLGECRKYLDKPYREGDADIAFVSRDNRQNRTGIEVAYATRIHQSKDRVWIANAYFFPSYRILRAIKKACNRGVDVRLILQGDPDIPFALALARSIYGRLTRYGVRIYEYEARPLHAKIAIFDEHWSTIGSSNLDPLSLAFNLEANVFIRNDAFNTILSRQIKSLESDSVEIKNDWRKKRRWWLLIKDVVLYHSLRHFPTVAGLIPAHTPVLKEISSHADSGTVFSKPKRLHRSSPGSVQDPRKNQSDDTKASGEG